MIHALCHLYSHFRNVRSPEIKARMLEPTRIKQPGEAEYIAGTCFLCRAGVRMGQRPDFVCEWRWGADLELKFF